MAPFFNYFLNNMCHYSFVCWQILEKYLANKRITRYIMKNFKISVIVFLFLNTFVLYSWDESGWENNGDYLSQKLVINNLWRVQLSEDNTQFYTFSFPDSTIRIWDLNTGVLTDSIVLEYKPDFFFFSTDRKTAVICKKIKDEINSVSQIYTIIDLISMEKIANSILFPFEILKSDYGNLYESYSFSLTSLDYSFTKKDMILSANFKKGDMGPGIIYWWNTGFSGIFKIKNDSLVKKTQFNNTSSLDFLVKNDTLYYISYTEGRWLFDGEYTDYTKSGLFQFSSITNSKIELLNYLQKPTFIIHKLLECSNDSKILCLIGYNYYLVDYLKDSIISGYSIPAKNTIDKMNSDRKTLIEYADSSQKFYLYPIAKPYNVDSIESPIEVNNYLTIPGENNILAYNTSGEIVWLKREVTGIDYKPGKSNLSIYPNPAKDIITIRDDKSFNENLNLTITNLQGITQNDYELVWVNSNKITIDISNLKAGVYILRVSNGIRNEYLKVIKF
jgi:hypothetical protein